MASVSWSRLIRFVPAGRSEVLYGEPVATNYDDIGAVADAGELQAKVFVVDASGPLSPSAKVTDEVVRVGKLLGPLDWDNCTDIKCIGLNYKKHIEEGGRAPPPFPSLFTKPTTALADYGDVVVIPKCAQENEADYEAELVAVIGENCKDVTPEEALKYVVGYTIGNDVSARKWQRNPERAGGVPQWCYAKSFDKFAPMGPCIVSSKVIPDPSVLHMKLSVNGDKRQETPISDLLFDVAHIVSFLSQGSTLRRGAVIMTGTPSGVGCTGPESAWKYLKHDDKLELEVSQIGVLRHTIAYE
ncbi:hypothetical protein JCM24511_01987 [Saitozyma sp. JCM 24511]|nr:hypothetical protein JCM24511_01987 [Saitozyma sp. JCM 24511]